MTYEKLQKLAERVPSAGTIRHAHILYGLVRWLQPQTIVEVGSWFGYTSLFLAKGLADNGEGQLFCIDKYSLAGGSPAKLHNVLADAELADYVRVLDADSRAVPWPQADLVFVDGDHSYEGCKSDVEYAMAAGASCIVVHDSVSWWGVRQWIEEFEKSEGYWSFIEGYFDEGLVVAMRKFVRPPVTYSQKEYSKGSI